MLKKASKTIAFLLILAASVSSFVYINSSSLNMSKDALIIEQIDLLPKEHSIVAPVVPLVKKAINMARGFFFPAE